MLVRTKKKTKQECVPGNYFPWRDKQALGLKVQETHFRGLFLRFALLGGEEKEENGCALFIGRLMPWSLLCPTTHHTPTSHKVS